MPSRKSFEDASEYMAKESKSNSSISLRSSNESIESTTSESSVTSLDTSRDAIGPKKLLAKSKVNEAYEFAGMHHIFMEHEKAGIVSTTSIPQFLTWSSYQYTIRKS